MKVLLDALMHSGLFTDDSQIDDLHIVRKQVRKNDGTVVVKITEI
jgi:Holliday junction resolvase RusA-like endonuclease